MPNSTSVAMPYSSALVLAAVPTPSAMTMIPPTITSIPSSCCSSASP